jgi:hypothetical protein
VLAQPQCPIEAAASLRAGLDGDAGLVPATEVAAWAGHSVEMLMRVYARCVEGLEGIWIGRMDQALHLEEPLPGARMGRSTRQKPATSGGT